MPSSEEPLQGAQITFFSTILGDWGSSKESGGLRGKGRGFRRGTNFSLSPSEKEFSAGMYALGDAELPVSKQAGKGTHFARPEVYRL